MYDKLSRKMKKANTKMMKRIDEAIAKADHILPITKRRKSRPRAKSISIHPHQHSTEQHIHSVLFALITKKK